MDSLKLKLIDELLEHMSNSQGGDLKSLMDKDKMGEGSPLEESMESPKDEEMEDSMGKPKGLSIEKVSVMAKPKPDEIQRMIDKKSSGVGPEPMDDESKMSMPEGMESKMDGMGDSDEMTDDELKELLSKYLS